MDNGKTCNRFLLGLLSTDGKRRQFLDRIFFLPPRLTRILGMLKSFEESRTFLAKVSKKDVPSYYEVIKRPMDLGTVQKKLWKYRSFEEFKADLDLIWDNCLEFNQGRYYRDCAVRMREVVRALEIEMTPVEMDPGFLRISSVVEGGECFGPVVRHILMKAIGRVLLSAGYVFGSSMALGVLSDVFQHKMLEIIRREVVEKGDGQGDAHG